MVIDSVAFHFRHDFQDMAHRARLLARMAQDLNRLAAEKNIAVVMVNQVTTKIIPGHGQDRQGGHGEGSTGVLVPALGEAWSHAATNRVVLFWKGRQRCAHLLKSPSLMNGTTEYCVNEAGIRDLKRGGGQKRQKQKQQQAPPPSGA